MQLEIYRKFDVVMDDQACTYLHATNNSFSQKRSFENDLLPSSSHILFAYHMFHAWHVAS